jgi:hypothetical protein
MAKSAAESGDNGLGVEWTSEVKVSVIPLHSLISKYGRPDFIKIDAEGFEEQVLEELKEVASRSALSSTPNFPKPWSDAYRNHAFRIRQSLLFTLASRETKIYPAG